MGTCTLCLCGEERFSAQVEFRVVIAVGTGPRIAAFDEGSYYLVDVIRRIEIEGILACDQVAIQDDQIGIFNG